MQKEWEEYKKGFAKKRYFIIIINVLKSHFHEKKMALPILVRR